MRSATATALLLATGATTTAAQGGCSPLHVIWARATTEPPGGVDNADAAGFEAAANRGWSKGYGAAGFSVFSNVTKLIPAATGWPVHYPASWTGCTSEDKGVADILNQLRTKAKACPNQKYVLGGHSQGGVVTVRAIPQIDKDILPRVIAVTMVGSPNCPAEVKDRCKSFCNEGDGICTGTGNAKTTGRCGTGAAGGAKSSAPPMAKAPKGLPKPAPKGSSGDTADMPGMSMGGERKKRAVESVEEAWTSDEKMHEWMMQAVADESMCAGPEVPEKGHKAVGAEGAHMLYNKDGYYTKAAACYILKQYKAAGSA